MGKNRQGSWHILNLRPRIIRDTYIDTVTR